MRLSAKFPLAIAFGLALLSGCENPSQASGSPVGTWKNQAGDTVMTLEIKADLKFTSVRPVDFGTYTMTGTCTQLGGKLILNYASGLLGDLGIPPPPINPDTAILSGNSLTLHIPYNYEGTNPTLILKKQ